MTRQEGDAEARDLTRLVDAEVQRRHQLTTSRDGAAHLNGIKDALIDVAAAVYGNTSEATADCQLLEFEHGSGTYLFDQCQGPHDDRTIAAVGIPTKPNAARDAGYQRGYPLPDTLVHRRVDRGHFIPYSSGGEFGPNIYIQDRALNRGWSEEGRKYRALERAAASAGPPTLLFVVPHYTDRTATPGFVTVGVWESGRLQMETFRNRYDEPTHLPLDVHLSGAVDSQIGALGEETVSILLTEELDATLVSAGDAGMPRVGNQQDLDLVVVLEGRLVAIEVKSRYLSRQAGRLTRAGNLLRPRIRAGTTMDGYRQASQPYLRTRVSGLLDTDLRSFDGTDVLIAAVDLRLMVMQLFDVSDAGRVLGPLGRPVPCRQAAQKALNAILDHRGYL